MAITGSDRALMYALGGIARGGATRGGYTSGMVFINHNTVHIGWGPDNATQRVLLDSLTITDELDETPNRCTYRTKGWVTGTGREVIITLGSKNNLSRLFAGFTVDIRQIYYADKPANIGAEVSCIDYTWQFNFVKVTRQYTLQSATTIAKDLISTYAGVSGFTSTNIAENLPVLDEITYTDEDLGTALTRLARRIGAYWYVDYQRDVHLFFEETGNGAPLALTPTHPSLAHVVSQTDRSQCLTRVYVEGRGSRLLSNVILGDTMIPLETVDMFRSATDVFVKASFQGSEGGAQHLNFSGVVSGGAGNLVGPGLTPSSALTAQTAFGAGIESGIHQYAYTWTTTSGETLPSPIGTVTTGVLPPPPLLELVGPWQSSASTNQLDPNAAYSYVYTYSRATLETDHTNETTASEPTATVMTTTTERTFSLGFRYAADSSVKWLHIYRTEGGGTIRKLCDSFQNYPAGADQTSVLHEGSPDTALGIAAPTVNTASANQVALSNVAIGPTGTISRKVYRTAANLSQLKLQQTIANNTVTTGIQDATPDASLGANAPISDTSGLTQPAGQVNPGSTSIIVASTTAFLASGGWAILGNGELVIRYSSLTGNALSGIPTTGVGSLTAAVTYNTIITAAPMLTGIPASGPRGITTRALTAGDEVYVVVQCDDTDRQATLAAEMKTGNGIREEWVQDRRLSIDEARARGNATLASRPLDQQTLSYICRDLRTASGKTITVNLPPPTNLVATLKIQQVTIHNFRPHAHQLPTFTVQASSQRFSFEDLLRVMRHKE